jgi:hypothetical protein
MTSGMMLILRQRPISLWRLPSEAPTSSLVVSMPISSKTAKMEMLAPMPSAAMLVMLVIDVTVVIVLTVTVDIIYFPLSLPACLTL